MRADAEASWVWPDDPYDFFETTRLMRTGTRDPTLQRIDDGLLRATRTTAGPATVRIDIEDRKRITARAFGPGADDALSRVPRWLGLHEPRWSLPPHPVTDRLLRRHPGVRLCDTGDVYEALVNIVLQQKVTWQEAAFTWRRLIETLGEPAPGPHDLTVPPAPKTLYRAGAERLVRLGIGRQRAGTLIEVAFTASRLQKAIALPTPAAARLLQAVRGIGPWTAAMVLGLRLGRPEPLVFGDAHLPNTVAWALAREPRGNDARMAELLQPFEGEAFRVVRLLFAARIDAPRRGPRREALFGLR